MTEKDWQEIVYLVASLLGVMVLVRIWTVYVRPWLETTWGQLTGGEVATLPVLGAFDTTDLIGIGVLAAPFLVVVFVVRSRVRKARAARSTRADDDRPVYR